MLVGVAKDLILNPRSVAGGFVYTYKLVNSGEKLEFLHKVRGAMGSFPVLSVGVGLTCLSAAVILQYLVHPGQDYRAGVTHWKQPWRK